MNLSIVTISPQSFAARELQKYLHLVIKNEFPIFEHASEPDIYLALEENPNDRNHFSIRANGKSFFIADSNPRNVL